MSSALAAQASGSPPGSLTTCAAIRAGKIRASPSSSVKFSMSAANAAISSVSMARAARAAGIRAEARSGVSGRLCRIKARSLALAREKHIADFGRVLWLHRQIRCHPQLRLARWLDRRVPRQRCRNLGGERHALIGIGGFQPELSGDFGRRARIDRKPRPNRRARRVVDLIDQAGGQFDKLPRFVVAVRAGLHVEVGQDPQQGRTNIDALPARERHQPVEAGKRWRCGHVRDTRLSNARASLGRLL